MNAETFCEHFATFAEAPNGVEKLRELILQLAVRGKLVPQDERDEPASQVLERFWTQNHYARKATASGVGEIPVSWTWITMGDLLPVFQNGESSRGGATGRPTIVLRLADIKNGEISFDDTRKMLLPEISSAKYRLSNGDILIIRVNGSGELVGRFILSRGDVDGIYCDHFIRMKVNSGLIDPQFLIVLGNCSLLREQIGRLFVSTAGQKTVNQGHVSSLFFPLPPLAEQKRIVAKVDQLLGLCDELAARQAARREARERLVGATLDRLVSARSPAEFPKHAHRLRDNFDRLFDTPTTIPQLRQAILQLAVQGQLVPQDPNDEPADSLVEQIEQFKREVTGRAGKIARLDSAAIGFPLPQGWIAVRFGDIMLNRDGERVPISREIREGRKGTYDYYGASGIIDSIDDFLFDKPLLLIGEDGANLINRSTPIAFIATGKYWVNNHAHVLDGISLDFLRYIALFINATDLKPFVTGTAQPKMNQAKMNSIPVYLPPLAEQKRIVAKVDQLLGLCDALEAKLAQSESVGSELLSAAVSQLLCPTG